MGLFMFEKHTKVAFLLFYLVFTVAACSSPTGKIQETRQVNKLQVVATTSIIADIVKNIGGDAIELSTLLPAGTDPHGFQPNPKDASLIADADIIFMNGMGLETFIEPLLENAGSQAKLISISEGIHSLQSVQEDSHEETVNVEVHTEEDQHKAGDPHVWTDPNNVLIWVDNIERALVEIDPSNSEKYQSNAELYRQSLNQIDGWIREMVGEVSPENRKLITDHTILAYFASRYGFEQTGTLISGFDAQSEPSAQDLANLEDIVEEYKIKAVFVGNTVNPALAERVATDTGAKLVSLFSDSLSPLDGPASTYLEYLRYNVNQITSSLR